MDWCLVVAEQLVSPSDPESLAGGGLVPLVSSSKPDRSKARDQTKTVHPASPVAGAGMLSIRARLLSQHLCTVCLSTVCLSRPVSRRALRQWSRGNRPSQLVTAGQLITTPTVTHLCSVGICSVESRGGSLTWARMLSLNIFYFLFCPGALYYEHLISPL